MDNNKALEHSSTTDNKRALDNRYTSSKQPVQPTVDNKAQANTEANMSTALRHPHPVQATTNHNTVRAAQSNQPPLLTDNKVSVTRWSQFHTRLSHTKVFHINRPVSHTNRPASHTKRPVSHTIPPAFHTKQQVSPQRQQVPSPRTNHRASRNLRDLTKQLPSKQLLLRTMPLGARKAPAHTQAPPTTLC